MISFVDPRSFLGSAGRVEARIINLRTENSEILNEEEQVVVLFVFVRETGLVR